MLTSAAGSAAPPTGPSPEAVKFEASLHKQSGDVAVPGAKATLHLGDRYYFLPADEAKAVLTKVWGNPPESADGVLGLVLEKDATVFQNQWGAVITYEDSGYVSDKDATSEDYDKVLQSIRDGEDERNEARRKAGYPTIHLAGWAQPPSYDPTNHALIWARDIKFSGQDEDSLNYDVRLLGRGGVLSLNMVSSMSSLPDVRRAAADFGRAASFDRGQTYADYDPATDKDAGYGLAGLVAAGAGVAVAKKLGLLAIVLGFGKKLLVLIAVAGAAIVRFGKKLFGRGENDGSI
jgi:uncharacterized membrane-anchored protein